VYLVGAGPGDPGLLTARALELISRAEVILCDRLIPAGALDGARPDAELVFVGKEGSGPSVPQDETEALMIARAQEGRTVVRLKGGDPFVFGRGGEEGLALKAASIPFEVVPGVTAGVAALAYAGIPVTHRGLSGAVALITGRTTTEGQIDWKALAAFPGTLVFYMAMAHLESTTLSLIDAGRDPGEAAAIVQAGTLPSQRTIVAELATVAGQAREAGIGAPAILAVGAVGVLSEQLAWLPPRPLAGVSVAVTRARAQASELASRLAALGADVVQAPVIRIHPLAGPPLDPSPYDLICLTSPNGVSGLFERLSAGGRDARSLAGARVAATGAATARALAQRGITADVVPERFVAEGLVEALADVPVRRALVARAREGRDVLVAALRERGADVDELDLFETVAEPLAPAVLARARAADYITFTSSSTVRHFLDAAAGAGRSGAQAQAGGSLSEHTRIVSIGPITSETLRECGLQAHVEAARHDIEGVISALTEDVQRRTGEPRQ